MIIHRPSVEAAERTALSRFRTHCEALVGVPIPDYAALQSWALGAPDRLWSELMGWLEIPHEGSLVPAIEGATVETARFFPNVTLNYARALLDGPGDGVVITARREDGRRIDVTRAQLRHRVGITAADLVAMGVRLGDRVVAVVTNQAEAMIAGLAAASLGATWSSVAPDLAVDAVLQRFAPLEPTTLVCSSSYRYSGAERPLGAHVAAILEQLPSVKGVLQLDNDAEMSGDYTLASMVTGAEPEPVPPTAVPFDHPLFILFSSGTTGAPKCIVHGHGGTLLEHSKELRLHCDLGPGDTLYFHTSCAWMMWNWQMSALQAGARIVVLDGSVAYPERDALLQLLAEENVTHFGTSPAYLQYCRDAGITPPALPRLRAIMSTGSILFDEQYDWASENLGQVPIQSISGGTDIIGCFVLGNPCLPTWRGEAQCVSLGLDVRAMTDAGPVRQGRGELVCVAPFPSRPVALFKDDSGARFHSAYFGDHEGVWTHGDFIELTDRGTARIHGRSDGVMNIQGVRIGPAEIYHALRVFPEVVQCLAIDQAHEREIGGRRLVLLLVLQPGLELDRPLTLKMKKQLKTQCSAVHVPKVVAQVDALPTTHSGKLSERAASDALNGREVRNRSALKNPEALDALLEHPLLT